MLRSATRVALALALALPVAAAAGAQDPPPTLSPGSPAGMDIEEHEQPVLAALEATPQADAIALRATALHFPEESSESLLALVADLPAGAPSLRPAEDEPGTFTQDFTVLALVRDDSGQIVHKMSRRYVLSWAEAHLEDLKVGRVLFAREARLPPGRYTVEVAARDSHEGKMGVTRFPLDLPAIDDARLRLSSLVVVGHAEADVLGEPSPLLWDGVRLYPGLGRPGASERGQAPHLPLHPATRRPAPGRGHRRASSRRHERAAVAGDAPLSRRRRPDAGGERAGHGRARARRLRSPPLGQQRPGLPDPLDTVQARALGNPASSVGTAVMFQVNPDIPSGWA